MLHFGNHLQSESHLSSDKVSAAESLSNLPNSLTQVVRPQDRSADSLSFGPESRTSAACNETETIPGGRQLALGRVAGPLYLRKCLFALEKRPSAAF